MSTGTPENRATLIGMIAIVLWSLLALLTSLSGAIPPFQLTAICFALASVIGIIGMVKTGKSIAALRQPLHIWLLGVGGLFGYHFFYFTALQNAPPIEAGLIAYLWPLLIILFSALLPGEKLRLHHLLGGFIGFSGAVLIISKGGLFAFDSTHLWGYAAAGLCAIIWAAYSVLSRHFATVSSEVVTGFCALTALLAAVAHLSLETSIWPQNYGQGLAILGLGLGPVGLAFYVWDHGVKRGNIQLLGAASYAAPILSTFALLAAGQGEFSWIIIFATLLVTLGALVAAKDMIRKS
ncbi:MAG: EamA family transporter [Rhizobiaceae bacterium]